MVKQISDNEIYLLIKYIKSVLWRVAKCLSYIEEARCLKVKLLQKHLAIHSNVNAVTKGCFLLGILYTFFGFHFKDLHKTINKQNT